MHMRLVHLLGGAHGTNPIIASTVGFIHQF